MLHSHREEQVAELGKYTEAFLEKGEILLCFEDIWIVFKSSS